MDDIQASVTECSACGSWQGKIKKETLFEIEKQVHPNFRSVPKNWKTSEDEWLSIRSGSFFTMNI